MKAIKRMPVVQMVVDNIKEYITSEDVKEGDKLPTEKVLCEKLDIGRSTLREAFRILEATGFVEIKQGKGAFVAHKKEADLEDVIEWFVEHEVELIDFIEVRMAIEPLAVKLAIKRATKEEKKQIKEIHDSFMEAVNQKDTANIILLDELFHNTIMETSKNKLLISINKRIAQCFSEFRRQTFRVPQNAENAVLPHTRIVDAILNNDVESGELHMKAHIDNVIRDLNAITEK